MENLSLVIFVQKLKMFLYKSYFSVTLSTGLIAYFHDYSYVLAIIPVLQRLNQICTVQGHCGACWRKWQLADTDLCVLAARLRRCPTLSNHVLWQSWMAAAGIKDVVAWLINYGSWHAYEKKKTEWRTHTQSEYKRVIVHTVLLLFSVPFRNSNTVSISASVPLGAYSTSILTYMMIASVVTSILTSMVFSPRVKLTVIITKIWSACSWPSGDRGRLHAKFGSQKPCVWEWLQVGMWRSELKSASVGCGF